VHIPVTEAEVGRSSYNRIAVTAPESQETGLLQTPSPVSTARRSFEAVSPISSSPQETEWKWGESQVLTDPKFIQKLKERKYPAADRHIMRKKAT
jgi:hypothetical protein